MASSSSDFDEALAYVLRCVQQESLSQWASKTNSIHFRDIFLYFQIDIYYNTVYYLYGHAHIQSIPGLYFDFPLYQRKIVLVTRLVHVMTWLLMRQNVAIDHW